MTTPPSAPDSARQPDPKLDLTHVTRTEFINAMAHLYRGELGEATAWRTRIDATSNWAVVLSATALSFVFADKSSERHVLIPIITLFVTFMLFMEARRYRFYDIWRTRARMIEINFYRPMLDGSAPSGCRLGGDAGSRSRVAALSHALVGSNRPAAAAQLPVDLRDSAGKLAGPPGLTSNRYDGLGRDRTAGRDRPDTGAYRHRRHARLLRRTRCAGRLQLLEKPGFQDAAGRSSGAPARRTSWIGVSVIT